MTRPFPLEKFDEAGRQGSAAPLRRFDAPAPQAPQPDLEEERLAAFDKGYRAGWDDAAAAHAEEQDRIAADLARNLQEMSFTYHEAQAAMQRETAEILRGMLDSVLPAAMHAALVEAILDRVRSAMSERSTEVEIVLAPGNLPRVERLIADRPAPPLRLRPEPSLGEGQAFLRIGSSEEKIDYDGLMAELAAMVDRFCEEVETPPMVKEAANG